MSSRCCWHVVNTKAKVGVAKKDHEAAVSLAGKNRSQRMASGPAVLVRTLRSVELRPLIEVVTSTIYCRSIDLRYHSQHDAISSSNDLNIFLLISKHQQYCTAASLSTR